ncbi:MaoC/PaaZ C-terminal domain-containing protein [Amycolatopsis sp. EV170708-02-1]|uniref:MaoC/PaaZ C-terminal domain-containing protein n=1 Tax=Amycolatopsis sp. EV170708-02-1 TaxID=2919322 RepID=UPI001F0CC3F4|nr:MaoC/PaaZ C-terminal domain-containing protein [Amycolatopsis sp. EV170708-02-1]UMP00048.1 MaoC family dehydratase N-terminal domain-containing protein [Amycolatopsis sp. EV170708-02-1]
MTQGEHVIRILPPGTPGLARSIEHRIGERWLRAFAVAVGDLREELFDLERENGIVGHPLFPVCVEWPLIAHGAPGIELSTETLNVGLHVSHRLRMAEPLRPGRRVRTEARLHRAEARRGAVHIVTEFRTFSTTGEGLVTTHLGTLYRGTRLEGVPIPGTVEEVPTPETGALDRVGSFDTDATNAVIYSECANIWNPIHTDIRVARDAGLPDTVLHGTETLARAVSTVTGSAVFPRHARVTGVDGRFTSPVFPGQTLTVNAGLAAEDAIAFDVRTVDGTPAISAGLVRFANR